MNCPECGAIMYVMNSKLITRNDDTPDKKTEIIRVQTLQCHNKVCGYTKTVEHNLSEQE